MINYEKYMRKCIALAKKSQGFVSPNPLVGAVVLDKNGNLIGEGRHEKYGEAHAEPNAIKNAKENGFDVIGGTLIVNLEPCSHHGKTPPCVDLIIKEKLKRVVIGCLDPNPKVFGTGLKKLEAAGIEVVSGVLENECKHLNEIFFKNQTQQMPFVALKTATTLDGKIATYTGSSKWITSPSSREFVQSLRNKYDAILTGSGTVLADNPSLTCRISNGRNPIRVIIDSELKTSPNFNVYNNDNTPVYIATKHTVDTSKFDNKNVEFVYCEISEKTGKIDIKDLVKKLYEKGIRSVLVEAGGFLNAAFIKAGVVDKLYQFVAPKILGDNSGLSFVSGYKIEDINNSIILNNPSVKTFGNDILITTYFRSIN